MKPQNIFQRGVVAVSHRVPKITKEQAQWGYIKCLDHYGQRNAKGVTTCTECGHKWEYTGDIKRKIACPSCSMELIIETTTRRVFEDCAYMSVISACGGYQVVRTFMLKLRAKVGHAPQYDCNEVMQRWIAPDGNYCTFARLRQTMGTCYIDAWITHTALELRSEVSSNKFRIDNIYDRIGTGKIYPKMNLIPELKRTGYKQGFYDQTPLNLFRFLLTNNRAETLLKTGQIGLFRLIMDDAERKIENYWPSIRIAIRNGYKITDASLWCDYIDTLRVMGKELHHHAKYVCPVDLHAEHNRYMDKLARMEARQELEEDLAETLKKELNYRRAKARFFGLRFSDGKIVVRVLETVQDIKTEGKRMHHCVGSYHTKEDSLILSATIEGKRIETIEVSLSKLKVIQCRGVCNHNTEHHNRIIKLVGRNMPLIEQRMIA